MAAMDKVFGDCRARQSGLGVSTSPFSKGIAWVEGQLVPLQDARIPLLDQGFMHSGLTYDVPSVWDGRLFRLDDHITRLDASCKKLRLRLPLPREEVKKILGEMVAKSGFHDAFVEIIVTRGLKGVRGARADELLNNSLYMFVQPYVWVMEPEMQPTGGKAIVARTVRRIPPGSIDTTVKNLHWGDLVRGLFEAADRPGFNMVLVKNGILYTPERGVLQGISRKSVIDVAKAKRCEIRVEFVPIEMAYQAYEIFVCTTAVGIMPITELDGNPVRDGKLGPITKDIWGGHRDIHYVPKFSFEIGTAVNGVH